MTKVAIYCRVSRDDPRKTPIERQEEDCRAYAEQEGWTVGVVYADRGISAADPSKVRPEFDRMLAAVESGQVDVVLFWKWDRLTRQMAQLERVREVARAYGARFIAVAEPNVDIGSDQGILLAQILMAVAEAEVRATRTRLLRQRRELAKQGKSKGGPRPFGYGGDHTTVIEEEAALIREACDRVLQGHSLSSICYDWRDRGIKTSTGKDSFGSGGLRKILTRWRNAGIREDLGEPVGPAAWPAIISEDTLMQVRTVLLGNPRKRVSRTFLLKGLLVCGKCGEKMQGNHKSSGVIRYQCQRRPNSPACGGIGAAAKRLEPWVWEQYCERMEGTDLSGSYDITAILVRIGEFQAKLNDLASDHQEGLMDRTTYLRLARKVNQQIEAANDLLDSEKAGTALEELHPGETLRDAWERPVHWKVRHLQSAIEKIVVEPGTPGTFDPSRFDIYWSV